MGEHNRRKMENDGFVMVQPRKKRGKSARESQKIRDARAQMQQTEDNYQEEHGPDAAEIAQTLRTCTAIVAKTSFAERVVALVASWCTTGSVVAPNDPVDIVCFGIGRVRSSRTAQHQAGMLFAMMTHAAVADTVLFDPCLHTTERQALAELGCGMIDENEKGAREVQRRTIFYMPHCEGELYNNVIWANRGQLHKIAIFGNSLSSYPSRLAADRYERGLGACAVASAALLEESLENTYQPAEVFNDTCFHSWPNALDVLADVEWPEQPAELYEDVMMSAAVGEK